MKNYILLSLGFLVLSLFSCSKKSTNNNPSNNGGGNLPSGAIVKALPSGSLDGITLLNSGSSVIFNVYAPGKKSVAVIGDFNNWKPQSMNITPDGTRWWVQVDNINPATEYAYQYYIDSTLKLADPYAEKILDPANDPGIPTAVYPNLKPYPLGQTGIVSVFQTGVNPYTWKTTNFSKPSQKNLVIYELLVRDFVATHTYKTLTDTLNYLSRLGVNAIELLPVNEFEGNDSWGYNTNFGFALDKYYGTKNDYKAFIDACHSRGIAVIQDIVLEDQFGSSPLVQMYATSNGSPSASNPWFDQTNMHPYAVGYQLNHQSSATQYYVENILKYWIQEYHIDGYRFDQSKGFTQTPSSDDATWSAYDASRIAILEKYNTFLKTLDPNIYLILEHFTVNSEESVLASQGMMLWTNLSTPAQQSTMGYPTGPNWDLSGLFYDGYGFSDPYNLVAYFESHDEERTMYKNEAYGNSSGIYNVKSIPTGLLREQLAVPFLLSSPGPKMLWQFEELGYDISINQNGRLGDKPFLWNYQQDTNRRNLFNVYSKMIRMKTKNPVFATIHFHYNLTGPIKTVTLLDNTANVEIVGNFDVVSQTTIITFPNTGTWYDNFNGKSISVTNANYSLTLAPGEYHVFSSSPLNY